MATNNKFASLKFPIMLIGLFLLALTARIGGLDEYVTVDEPYWVRASHGFISGLLYDDYICPPIRDGRSFETNGWGCTLQGFHPGVTTMWAGSLGFLLHYWQTAPPGVSLQAHLESLAGSMYDYHTTPELVRLTRLPIVFLSALFIVLFYLMLRKLLPERVALTATLLLVIHPFHISLSRVLHHDALTTTFIVLSLLAMIGYWLKGWGLRWLIISAILAGLAVLSKPVGWFTIPLAGLVGVIGVYYSWVQTQSFHWAKIKQLALEGILWGVIVLITFVALFPAMWVIPGAVIKHVFIESADIATEGHLHYFLGQISDNPGPLFYPIGWPLRASPLEIIGLLILPVATWQLFRSNFPTSLRQYIFKHAVLTALALFLVTFLLFETYASKKMVRYFLPAIPVIDIFVAMGLLWLVDKLVNLNNKWPVRRWTMPILAVVIFAVHGWFVVSHYPYYLTYYNPLFGGNRVAAQIMTIVGWGEGMKEVATYLNRQPDAASLKVITWYERTLKPFFVGQTSKFPRQAGDFMAADYLVYYINQLQRHTQRNDDVWRYFDRHSPPVYRVTLNGLEYAWVYRNPIEHHVNWQENSLPGAINIFGYNITPKGELILFWQNLGLNDERLWAGLSTVTDDEITWLATCAPTPGFAAEVDTPGAIIESMCSLQTKDTLADAYDLHLGLGDESGDISPIEFPGGRLALSIDKTGQLTEANQASTLALVAERELPNEAVAQNIAFAGLVQLVGYQLKPAAWQTGNEAELLLYWQPLQKPEFNMAEGVELELRLFANTPQETILTATKPLFAQTPTGEAFQRGDVIPASYPVSLPDTLPAGEYWLETCLKITINGQIVKGVVVDTSERIECLKFPVTVEF